MSDIVGHVDARNRPIVSLVLPDQEDALLVIVDTGFNGQLLVPHTELPRLKYDKIDLGVPIELAGGEKRTVMETRAPIIWFGQLQTIGVLITVVKPPYAPPDEPVALLGTALLNPHRLAVDFATRRVVISQSDA